MRGGRFLQQRSTPPTEALAPTVIAEYLAVSQHSFALT